VFVTQPKEPHYFALHGGPADFRGPGDAATINRVAVTERVRYINLFPAQHDYLALGEGSVSTLYYAERAVQEITTINPRMRVVVILRDPVERAYSSYSYMRARGFEPHEDFYTALADEQRRRSESWHHLWHYTGMSYYASCLRTLKDALGPDQVRVWFYDDMVNDYEAVVSSVLRFIEVSPHPDEAKGVGRVNVSGTPRHPSLQRAIWWATRHESLRRTAKQLSSYTFRERIRRNLLRPTGVPRYARDLLNPLFRDDLREVAGMVEGNRPIWLTRHV